MFRIGVIAAIALMLGFIAYGAGEATIMTLEDLIGVLYIDTSSSLTVFQISILIGVGLVSLTLVVAFAIVVTLCAVLVVSIPGKTYDAITNRAAKKPDGIIIAYLKAKHRKICPMITFKNE